MREIAIRHRRYLAGSDCEHFPMAIAEAGPEDAREYRLDARARRDLLAKMRELVQEVTMGTGAVVLRETGLATHREFSALIAQLGHEVCAYQGGMAVRSARTAQVFDASLEPAEITLTPHNELAYAAEFPRIVVFFCEEPAPRGGEVPINDIMRTTAALPRDVASEFERRGIRYTRYFPDVSDVTGRSWVDSFGSSDRAQVERALAASKLELRWDPAGGLLLQSVLPAFRELGPRGERLFFNQVTELNHSYWDYHPGFTPGSRYPADTHFGDGGEIASELICQLRGLIWQTTKAVRLGRGDVLLLDNRRIQHGRMSFEGERRHYVSLLS